MSALMKSSHFYSHTMLDDWQRGYLLKCERASNLCELMSITTPTKKKKIESVSARKCLSRNYITHSKV